MRSRVADWLLPALPLRTLRTPAQISAMCIPLVTKRVPSSLDSSDFFTQGPAYVHTLIQSTTKQDDCACSYHNAVTDVTAFVTTPLRTLYRLAS